jgi:hypothetical protein
MKKGKVMRNFRYWTGLNDFYCKGCVMTGPGGLKLYIHTLLYIVLPLLLFYMFSILVIFINK